MTNNNYYKSIMAIDDEYDIVSVIQIYLQNHGFKCSKFTNPYEALEHFALNSKEYDVVISDIRMPGMNGYELVKQIKEINSQVKIILTSAFEVGKNELLDVLGDLKIDAFIQKPFSLPILLNTLHKKSILSLNIYTYV